MADVTLDITMSRDGFVTAPNDAPGNGLGDDGEVLHFWVFGGPWTYRNPAGAGRKIGASNPMDQVVLDEIMSAGAAVVGRRMFEVAGGWGGRPPFGTRCIVVTHRLEDQPDPTSGFEFINGIEAAVHRAKEIAGERHVAIGGGASVARQALQLGLVDDLQVHVAPVVLGAGRPLFGETGARLHLEPVRVLDSPFATHLKYRVLDRPAEGQPEPVASG